MGFRNYDPSLNRFLTRDMYEGALSDAGMSTDPYAGNRYAFAGGNPISNIELDGHMLCDDAGRCGSDAFLAKVDAAPPTCTDPNGCDSTATGSGRGQPARPHWLDNFGTAYQIEPGEALQALQLGKPLRVESPGPTLAGKLIPQNALAQLNADGMAEDYNVWGSYSYTWSG